MSEIFAGWGEPDSRPGIVYDLLWTVLAVVLFGAIAYWEPVSITVAVTPQNLGGAAIPGGVLSVALAYGSFGSERFQRLWADLRIRFAILFGFVMAAQIGLFLASTWTVLTLLAAFLLFIPLRVGIYFWTR